MAIWSARAALKAFLDELGAMHEEDESLTDTDVRELLAELLTRRLVLEQTSVEVPSEFQLYDWDDIGHDGLAAPNEELNDRMHDAVWDFIRRMEASPEWQAAGNPTARQALIARDDVRNDWGETYELYLGIWDTNDWAHFMNDNPPWWTLGS